MCTGATECSACAADAVPQNVIVVPQIMIATPHHNTIAVPQNMIAVVGNMIATPLNTILWCLQRPTTRLRCLNTFAKWGGGGREGEGWELNGQDDVS